jgi:hypothetical protein
MKRPSKKDIKEAVEKLKEQTSGPGPSDPQVAKPTPKKSSQRIRKQGV